MRYVVACLAIAAMSGCASSLMSDSRLQAAIAKSLNEPDPSDVQIISRDEQWPATYVTVVGKHTGKRRCIVGGGDWSSLGVIYPPACS